MKRLLLAGLLIALLALAACESAQEFESPDVEESSPAEQGEVDESPDEEGSEAPPEEQMSARERVQDICRSRPDFMIDYEVEVTAQGESQTAQQTVVSKGDNYKQSVKTDELYVIDSTVFDCRQQNSTWRCYEYPQPEDQPEIDAEDACSVPENVSVSSLAERQIAGRTAECFEFTLPDRDVKEVNCYSNGGMPLYSLQESQTQKVERTATSVSTNVPDSEFELPAEPVKLSEEDLRRSQNAQPR